MTREVDGASLAGALLAGATRTFLVPAVLGKVMEMGPDAIALFNRLRTFVYGASPMPPALLAKALKEFPNTDFVQVYGLTEVCGAVTQLSPEAHRDESRPERLTSAGQPARQVEVRVVNPDTLEDVADGRARRIVVPHTAVDGGLPQQAGRHQRRRSPTTAGSAPATSAGSTTEGFVFVEDRLKDMIISGGENIYSVEVERALTDHPAVLDAAVFGIPDDKWGESVKAVVELSAGQADLPGGAGRLVPGEAGALQVPAQRRHHGRAAPQPHRQAAQEGSA